jgi:peptidoglycan/xylan/chitin deacetylase (PgdA/CDA1 family)
VRRFVPVAALVAVAAAVVVIVAGAVGHRSALHPAPAAAAPKARAPRTRAHRHARHRFVLPRPPAQVRGAAARRMAIPILTYHVVANPPPQPAYPFLWVRPAVFAAEMHALRRAGYRAITLRAAYGAWTSSAALPRKPVVLSFDDGYRGDYTHARPVLRALGWPGVLNLVADHLRSGDLPAREVRALVRNGWEIDSHTITHRDLTLLDDAQLRHELVDSRRELRARFGVRVQFFCYPAGRYDAHVVAAVRAAGYLGATTEVEGYARPCADIFTLPRIRVNASDTP